MTTISLAHLFANLYTTSSYYSIPQLPTTFLSTYFLTYTFFSTKTYYPTHLHQHSSDSTKMSLPTLWLESCSTTVKLIFLNTQTLPYSLLLTLLHSHYSFAYTFFLHPHLIKHIYSITHLSKFHFSTFFFQSHSPSATQSFSYFFWCSAPYNLFLNLNSFLLKHFFIYYILAYVLSYLPTSIMYYFHTFSTTYTHFILLLYTVAFHFFNTHLYTYLFNTLFFYPHIHYAPCLLNCCITP